MVLLATAITSTAGWAAAAPKTNDPQPPRSATTKPKPVATNAARLTAFIDASGFVIRSKNVLSVQHPFDGVYCIQPSPAANIKDVDKLTPVGVADYSTSLNPFNIVQYRSSGFECPPKTIEFLTASEISGSFQFVNAGFVVVVP